jgi:hypothetical protein
MAEARRLFGFTMVLLWTHPVVAFLPSGAHPIKCYTVSQNEPSLLRRDMFTGIVEEMGTVVALEQRDDMTLWDGSKGKGTELTVQADVVLEGAYLG